jgi:methylthioribose-1-phosphate isomerase
MMIPIRFENDTLYLIDQLKLPREEVWVEVHSPKEAAVAIKDMIVRGAPAIGVTAAYGMALGFKNSNFNAELAKAYYEELLASRPTAVNLKWALDRMMQKGDSSDSVTYEALKAEAILIHEEDIAMNQSMGKMSLELVPDGAKILTHCNAGSLATGGYGTAVGMIYAAHEAGKLSHVWVDETRPFLQGARLTATEIHAAGVPYSLICDNMAGSLMAKGEVDLVVVGADRIAANGDVANKIGTYSLAVLCHYHKIPFYVIAPYSTLDFDTETGNEIPIEKRAAHELSTIAGVPIAKNKEAVYNPGFDVTPAGLVTAIVTNKGIARAPFKQSLKSLHS